MLKQRDEKIARVSLGHLLAFFAIAFLVTWGATGVFWLVAANDGESAGTATRIASYLGVWGPSLAGFIMAWRGGGLAGVYRLLSKLWRSSKFSWYVVGLLLPLVFHVTAAAVGSALGHYDFSRAVSIDATRMALFVALTLPSGPLGEEYGWRGFALPALADRMPRLAAALLIAAVWTLWHLPAFVAPDLQRLIFPTGITFWELGALTMSGGVIACWLTFRAQGGIGPAVLFHLGMLTIPLGVHESPPPPLSVATVLVYIAAALVIVAFDWRLGGGREPGKSSRVET